MVDSGFALYLQSAERVATAVDAPHAAAWGALVRTLALSSGIANEADAIVEAGRALAFVKGPLAEVRETIAGKVDISAIKGRVVTVDGIAVFVLGGGYDRATNVSVIDGLRRN